MYFKCKCGKTFKTKKSKQCHIGRVHTAAYCKYCNERHEDINTHLRWYCKKNPKSRDYKEEALEELLRQKKQSLVMKQMNDMMKDDKPVTKFGQIELYGKLGRNISISVSPDAHIKIHGDFTDVEYKGPETK